VSGIESRFVQEAEVTSRAKGKSSVEYRCPFCFVTTEGRLFTLPGTGKRCDCGAVVKRFGDTKYFFAEKRLV